jgi:hypothetical protein
MTYDTHLYLGTLLYPVIRDFWDIPLSKKRFLYGCVKPDISSLFVRHPHFYGLSRKFIFKKIKKLCNLEPRIDTKNKKFSEQLGIVLHYTADFFTAVHNTKTDGLKEHMQFEKLLFSRFITTVNKNTVRSFFLFHTETESGALHIIEEIKRLHAEYQPDRKDPFNDLGEILTACAVVTSGIMNNVLANRATEEKQEAISGTR